MHQTTLHLEERRKIHRNISIKGLCSHILIIITMMFAHNLTYLSKESLIMDLSFILIKANALSAIRVRIRAVINQGRK